MCPSGRNGRRSVAGASVSASAGKPQSGRSRSAIDAHVGGRIQKRRIAAGLTLRELGRMIDISQGQVHKFERAKNRVPVGLLYRIASVLDAPIGYFFDGLGSQGLGSATPAQRKLAEMMHNFSEIQNEKHREAFSQLVHILAEN
jgi:transcriptional regulator with XRE-family HTH domain